MEIMKIKFAAGWISKSIFLIIPNIQIFHHQFSSGFAIVLSLFRWGVAIGLIDKNDNIKF